MLSLKYATNIAESRQTEANRRTPDRLKQKPAPHVQYCESHLIPCDSKFLVISKHLGSISHTKCFTSEDIVSYKRKKVMIWYPIHKILFLFFCLWI